MEPALGGRGDGGQETRDGCHPAGIRGRLRGRDSRRMGDRAQGQQARPGAQRRGCVLSGEGGGRGERKTHTDFSNQVEGFDFILGK